MDRKTFFEYVTDYWDLAGAEGRDAELVRRMLAALRDSEPTIGRRPDDEENPRSGYLSHLQVAWFRRSELTRLGKTFRENYEKEFVKETGAFVARTTSFIVNGDYEALQESRFAALRTSAVRPRECGAVIVGRQGAIGSNWLLVIAITPDVDIVSL